MLSTWTSDLKMSSPGMGSGSSERRQYARYPFTGALEAFEPESQTRIQGRTADLSEGGCYVDTMNPFSAQTRVKVRVTKEKRSFESQATVVYSVAGMGMGLQFEATDPQEIVTLRKWLNELSGERTAGTEIEDKSASARDAAESNRVLSELVSELMRKHILDENMGREMLQRLA